MNGRTGARSVISPIGGNTGHRPTPARVVPGGGGGRGEEEEAAGLNGENQVSQAPEGVNTKKALSLWVFLKGFLGLSMGAGKLWINYW